MRFFTSNIIPALKLAIKEQEEIERKKGYFSDSGLLANWKMFLVELEKRDTITL